MNTLVQAETVPSESRGGLLYSTHCSTCHTSAIHWRERKLATDWKSLKAQVNRWQSYNKLGWREEDIADVTYYLNIHYYNFPSIEPKALSQGNEFEKT
jgi:mono/diheme cytochrome c family protein